MRTKFSETECKWRFWFSSRIQSAVSRYRASALRLIVSPAAGFLFIFSCYSARCQPGKIKKININQQHLPVFPLNSQKRSSWNRSLIKAPFLLSSLCWAFLFFLFISLWLSFLFLFSLFAPPSAVLSSIIPRHGRRYFSSKLLFFFCTQRFCCVGSFFRARASSSGD